MIFLGMYPRKEDRKELRTRNDQKIPCDSILCKVKRYQKKWKISGHPTRKNDPSQSNGKMERSEQSGLRPPKEKKKLLTRTIIQNNSVVLLTKAKDDPKWTKVNPKA